MVRHASPMKSPAIKVTVAVMLAVAIGGALWVPIYAHLQPKLGDFPFFYWYQLILVPVTAFLCWICYLLLRTERAAEAAASASTRRRGDEPPGRRRLHDRHRLVPGRHRAWASSRPGGAGRGPDAPRRVGPGRPRLRHLDHLVPARRRPLHGVHVRRRARAWCTRPARPASSPCRTRSWSTRSSSSSCRGCGRSPTRTATSRRPTSSAAATARRGSALAVAVTGILATMPYIALQLVGIQAVLRCMGVGGGSSNVVRQGPAADHRVRGARGLHLPGRAARAGADRVRQGHPDLPGDHRRGHLHPEQARRLGRTSSARRGTPEARRNPATGKPYGSLVVLPAGQWAYATLALGSALALFMYPHSVTGVLAAKRPRRDPAQRGHPAGVHASCSACSRCSATWRDRGRREAASAARQANAAAVRAAAVRRACSRAGSPASPSRPSPSARWCRRRSCRSPRRTCSPATSTRSTSGPTPRPARRPRSRKLASLVVKVGALVFVARAEQDSSRSTCSCSAGSGSCRRSRPS